MPPGPPRKFIIGNAFDMPVRRAWETYESWAKNYGDLVSLKVFGLNILILNSRQMTHELFDKRSSIYSDRPLLPMINDLMDWSWGLPFQPYGEIWRRHRRVLHEKVHAGVTETFRPVQLKYTRTLLKRLLTSPSDYYKHVTFVGAETMMEMIYGTSFKSEKDPFLVTAEAALEGLQEAWIPGAFWVDALPWMKYIPEWFPGAQFQRKAGKWRQAIHDMKELPFLRVKLNMLHGVAKPSFVASHLEELAEKGPIDDDQEETIKNTAAIAIAGGLETTVATRLIFMLAMILYPEVQRKAQEELDNMLGWNRLVEFEDYSQLPYVNAICKEVLRWHPLIPQGMMHTTSQDDIVGEYFIPKGAILIGNVWRLLHNEKDFGPDTEQFIPERFFQPGVRDPAHTGAFGFGRRICPGRNVAESSLFIGVASMLQVFEISRPLTQSGKEVPFTYDFMEGLLSQPKEFPCVIRPRSEEARMLILQG
ncbi:hypothetical protein M422DRAFT_238752 [Sphaerobolus stellatus SS14]|nr:hypothetical protein M422DRAFT_238752 [Sphaerobolus stellatus SS14]